MRGLPILERPTFAYDQTFTKTNHDKETNE
jgi:hypothetical protein